MKNLIIKWIFIISFREDPKNAFNNLIFLFFIFFDFSCYHDILMSKAVLGVIND